MAAGKPIPKTGAGHKKANSIKSSASVKRPWDKDPNRSPKERIFLSIDTIGSTKLKSDIADRGGSLGEWAEDFAAFFSEAAASYRKRLVEVIEKYCPDKCPNKHIHRILEKTPHKVNIWKYIGDEVVLTAVLTCEKRHASLHVLALSETIKHLNKNFEDRFKENRDNKENPIKMCFKGAAWVAGFPVKNIELDLTVSTNDSEKTIKDFLGPSMDLGFRLSKLASDDRLIISASLAYLIVNEPPRNKPFMLLGENDLLRLPLCYGGVAEIKGIKGNKHPLIWFPVNSTGENILSFVENDLLLNYLKKSPFINMEIPPFILGDGDVSPKYMEEYNKAEIAQRRISGSPFYQKGMPHTPSKKGKAKTTLEFNAMVKDVSSKS